MNIFINVTEADLKKRPKTTNNLGRKYKSADSASEELVLTHIYHY